MSHIMQVKPDGFAGGFFVIQPFYAEDDFDALIKSKLTAGLIGP